MLKEEDQPRRKKLGRVNVRLGRAAPSKSKLSFGPGVVRGRYVLEWHVKR